jgi:ATP-dependent Clp protease ATP-binding subunit ClpB
MFNPLSRNEIEQIVKIHFNDVLKMLSKNDIKVSVSDKAIEWLAQLGYDPQFGARPLKRVMQKKILNELSKEILAGKINKENEIKIDLNENNDFAFGN